MLLRIFFTYAQKWEMKQAPLMTPWSKNIDIHHVLPEYPRPLMQREDWKNLNGVWEFEMSTEGDLLPTKENFMKNPRSLSMGIGSFWSKKTTIYPTGMVQTNFYSSQRMERQEYHSKFWSR